MQPQNPLHANENPVNPDSRDSERTNASQFIPGSRGRVIHPVSSLDDIKAAQAAEQAARSAATPPAPSQATAAPESQISPPNTGQQVEAPTQATEPASSAPMDTNTSSVPANLYPAPTTGSRLSTPQDPATVTPDAEKSSVEDSRLPIGVYIIAGVVLLNVAAGLIFNSKASALYWASVILDGLLAMGMLTRSNFARKAFIVIAILASIVAIFNIFSLTSLKGRTDGEERSTLALITVAETKATPQQKASLEKNALQIAELGRKLDDVYTKAYIREGIEIGILSVAVIYLSQWRVRSTFH